MGLGCKNQQGKANGSLLCCDDAERWIPNAKLCSKQRKTGDYHGTLIMSFSKWSGSSCFRILRTPLFMDNAPYNTCSHPLKSGCKKEIRAVKNDRSREDCLNDVMVRIPRSTPAPPCSCELATEQGTRFYAHATTPNPPMNVGQGEEQIAERASSRGHRLGSSRSFDSVTDRDVAPD